MMFVAGKVVFCLLSSLICYCLGVDAKEVKEDSQKNPIGLEDVTSEPSSSTTIAGSNSQSDFYPPPYTTAVEIIPVPYNSHETPPPSYSRAFNLTNIFIKSNQKDTPCS